MNKTDIQAGKEISYIHLTMQKYSDKGDIV